jgi:hypothetical protein
MRHVVFRAKFLGQAVSFDAKASFPRICGVINAGMNDPAVAAARRHSELRQLFGEKNVLPATGERFGDGTADDSAANDQNVDLIHHSTEYNKKTAAESILFVAVLIEKALARLKTSLGSVVHGKLRAFGALIAILPKRRASILPVLR